MGSDRRDRLERELKEGPPDAAGADFGASVCANGAGVGPL